MMLALVLLAGQAPAAAASPLADNAQLACNFFVPGEPAATALNVNLRARRGPNAMLAFARGSRFAGVTATSVAARRADGATVVGFANGPAGYRMEFSPVRDGARLRIQSVVDRATRATVAQGFCSTRGGRRIGGRAPALLPVDDMAATRQLRLLPTPGRLSDGTCRVVSRDRRTFEMSYRITAAQANEVTVAYSFVTADRGSATVQTGSGTQFYLSAPGERMVATTVSLGAATPTYVHTTYERFGSFVDLSRDGQIFAAGECGASPSWIAAAPGAAR